MVTAARQSKQRRLSRRPFPEEEYDARLKRVRQAMAERSLDGMLISSPENIYYLTGLNYLGYFAYQLLVEATRLDSVADLLQRTVGNTATKRESAPV